VADCFDNCPQDSNTNQGNQDGDAYGDACDCAPSDPNDPPGPVGQTLLVDKAGPTEAALSWSYDGVPGTFAVYRGFSAANAAFAYNHQCLGAPTTATTMNDTEMPSQPGTYYYLIGRMGCEDSHLGTDSSDNHRPNPSPCN
jgi:hypothetical protein